MAVEARHFNLFSSQISTNSRDLMMNGVVDGNGNVFSAPMGFGVMATETVLPMYGTAVIDTVPAKTPAMKSDSGLTYAVPISRKRSRDAINPILLSSFPNQTANNRCGSVTFLGEDISYQFQHQHLEIDRYIAQHTERVRSEIEERRKRYNRRFAAAVEENAMKRLKSKQDEIERIGKLNWALEERVKSLCVENQIWRDLAQTNEATANALRINLEQVLNQVHEEQQNHANNDDDDAESCCGSNIDEADWRILADCAASGGKKIVDGAYSTVEKGKAESSIGNKNNRMCRNCWREESCVLLLPCRHLCLCTGCGSTLHTCPVCDSTKTASLHVNLSSN